MYEELINSNHFSFDTETTGLNTLEDEIIGISFCNSIKRSWYVVLKHDNEKIILKRYETYLEKTLPILKHYERLNLLHEIEGKTGIDQIFGKIRLIIASLEA